MHSDPCGNCCLVDNMLRSIPMSLQRSWRESWTVMLFMVVPLLRVLFPQFNADRELSFVEGKKNPKPNSSVRQIVGKSETTIFWRCWFVRLCFIFANGLRNFPSWLVVVKILSGCLISLLNCLTVEECVLVSTKSAEITLGNSSEA